MARLGDFIEQIRGVSYKPDDVCPELRENCIALLRANNIREGQLNFDDVVFVDKKRVHDNQLLKAGDILICTSSGSKELVGKAAYVQKDLPMTFGAFCKVVRPQKIRSDYLGHFFNSPNYRQKISDSSAGANINNIRNEHIDDLEILLPTADRQEHIAIVLNKLTNLISLRKQQLAKLDELVKARFVEMFGDLTINSKGLKIVHLSEVAEYFNGLTYKPENVSDIGTIVLRSSNIQDNQLDFADTVRVNCQIKERLFVRENDILMCSRNGSARLVGKVALIRELNEPMSFGAFMMIIRSKYYPYLVTYFQDEDFRRQIKTGATTTINQITGRMLDEVVLPVPELKNMAAFESFTEKIFRQKLTIQQSLDKLEVLRKSLMQEYFG